MKRALILFTFAALTCACELRMHVESRENETLESRRLSNCERLIDFGPRWVSDCRTVTVQRSGSGFWLTLQRGNTPHRYFINEQGAVSHGGSASEVDDLLAQAIYNNDGAGCVKE